MLKITAVCPTYCRPAYLANTLACFEWQDYPNKHLIILDDAGQFDPTSGENWTLHSTPDRFPTLGDKRNRTVELIPSDTDLIAVFDDDDIYLPDHLSTIVRSLEGKGEYCIPRLLYTYTSTAHNLKLKHNQFMFHGSWGFTRDLFERVGGYPAMDSGQDQHLLKRFKAIPAQRAYQQDHQDPPHPTYIYRWFSDHGVYHVSASGMNYPTLADRPKPHIGQLTPKLERDWLNLVKNLNTP